jgi:hypothetical protein
MKKLVLITSIVIANLLIAAESKGQNSVYIITEVFAAGYASNLSSINNYNGFEFISLSKQLIVSNL